MANKTKAELINEIKELEAASNSRAATIVELRNDCSNLSADKAILSGLQHDYRKEIKRLGVEVFAKSNEINNLRTGIENRDYDLAELRNEIKDLHDSVRQRDALITGKDKEVAHLRVLLDADEKVFDKKDNEIKDLRANAASNAVDAKSVLDYSREMANENKGLRAMVTRGETLIAEKDKEIKELRAGGCGGLPISALEAIADTLFKKNKELQADALRAGDLANENKELRGYRAKAKVVKARLRNEIKDLQQELATSRDYSDKQADVIRHYVNSNAELDKAATNLQHFRRFSND